MFHQFDIQQFHVLSAHCIYVFCVDLRTNSDTYSINWLVFFNRKERSKFTDAWSSVNLGFKRQTHLIGTPYCAVHLYSEMSGDAGAETLHSAVTVSMQQVLNCSADFREIPFERFSKVVEKIQVSLKSDKNNGTFLKTNVHFLLYLAKFFLEWEMFQT